MAENVDNGGEATLIEGRLLAGQSDADVRALFDAARREDYEEIARVARRLLETGPASGTDIARLQQRLADVGRPDFFGAPERRRGEAALAQLDRHPPRRPAGHRAEYDAPTPTEERRLGKEVGRRVRPGGSP